MKHNALRLLALMLAAMMALMLVACSGGTTEPAPEDAADVSTTTAAEEDTTTTTASEAVEEETTTAPESTTSAVKTTNGSKKPSSTKKVTTTSGKNVMTFTTTEGYTEATTAAPKNPLRVLSIGHSFSKDAMDTYLWDLLDSSGKYDYIVIAYLFYPGCSLDRQWDHISGRQGTDKDGNAYEYQQYRKTDPYTGEWELCYKPDEFKNLAAYAIQDEKWDIITLQPSPDYGTGPENCGGTNDYEDVGNILNWIRSNKTNAKAKVYYHMTWAFSKDCKLWSYQYSNWDQMTQYKGFVSATQKYIFNAHPNGFAGIIPAGTAIQNARSSKLGDVFNMPGGYEADNRTAKDGYHLNDRGDLVAALTWYSVLTGKKASTAKCPDEWKSEWKIFTEAVDNAVKKPYQVTQSSYK